jgi:uncharacterized protein YkwD
MKATLALALANAVFATANPLNARAYVTQVDVKTVTNYVYPDGSPATHAGAQPSPGSSYSTPAEPATGSSDEPSTDDSAETEEPTEAEKPSEDSGSGSGGSSEDLNYTGGENGADVGSVYDAAINAHNAHRANHTCGQVTWSEELAAAAKTLADSCEYKHNTDIGGGGYGQNIAMGAQSNFQLTDGQAMARAITRQWYNNEYELYPNYGGEPDMALFEEWGHLSQIIWSETTEIGCAIGVCDGGELAAGMDGYFAVCNYSPPGNVEGAYSKNVLPATAGMKVLPA